MEANEFSSVDATFSPLQESRRAWDPQLPRALLKVSRAKAEPAVSPSDKGQEALAALFPATWGQPLVYFHPDDDLENARQHKPLRLGVVLSGGQAAGGHNVIAGIFDYVKRLNQQSQLIGFLNGPHGIFTHNYREISDELMNRYRNMGGFDMICSGRHKIESEEHKRKSLEICQKLDLHGLVIIGGDDSNTNGAILAEYFKASGCTTRVIGAPKTIDGDLRNVYIEASFGFDTACKVYSELIGNLCADAATSQDRYHFVRLMGRSASHITLECALQTRANLTFIGEEVEQKKRSLKSICDEVCDMVIQRAQLKKEYGVILVPEGLIEFIPEVGALIMEINEILAGGEFNVKLLTEASRAVFEGLPEDISKELLSERDSHGNVQVSRIATEKLVILMVSDELRRRNFNGLFIPTAHFFGYEGRCAMPSNFDANYCYALGHTCASLIDNGLTGYMGVIRHLDRPVEEWVPAGCPITMMMNLERRKGKDSPVIKKYLVELDKPLFKMFAGVREDWKIRDLYRNPGPMQFEGVSSSVSNYTIVPPTQSNLLPSLEPSKFKFAKSIEVLSPLQAERLRYRVPIASLLTNPKTQATTAKKCEFHDAQQERFIRRAYPLQCDLHGMRAYAIESAFESSRNLSDLRIGVVLLGQAVPGAANVVHGLYERVSLVGGKLFGFKGITGLLEGEALLIEREDLALYVNQGGFELLGRTARDRSSLRVDASLAKVASCCTANNLTGLVLIGGKFSLTDTAVIAEHFLAKSVSTRVIGVPANAENNVRHPLLEHGIGFDSTSKSYSSLIGNLLTDAASATKYWYFIRIMGNVTSHIVLETALQTHPNFVVVSEKYVEENKTLSDVVRDIADLVVQRAEHGKNFGAVLIPEGLLTSIPQMKILLGEIDSLWASGDAEQRVKIRQAIVDNEISVLSALTPWSAALLRTLPLLFREELTRQTPTGRLEVSELGAESLLAAWVERELMTRKAQGTYKGSFSPMCHYLGFQGRFTMPSDFDCALGSAHGYLASILVESDLTGMLTSVRGLCGKPKDWRFSAIPITALTRVQPDAEEQLFGRRVPIIPGYEVDLNGSAYEALMSGVEAFSGAMNAHYNRTLFEEQYEYMSMLESLDSFTRYVESVCSFGVNKDTLKTAVVSLQALADIISDVPHKHRKPFSIAEPNF